MIRHRRPMVFEVRDLWPEIPIQMGYLRSPLTQWCARALARLAYSCSREIIALSPGMRDGIRRAYAGTVPVTVIPNAADTQEFDPSVKRAVPSWWPSKPGALTAIYAGTFGRANDLSWIVDVARELTLLPKGSRVEIVLIGNGHDRPEVERRVRTLGVEDTVHVVDPRPKSEMPSILAAASACLSMFAPFPLLETTSPNKLFDGLAAGRPVLINYGGWQEEVLRDYNAGVRLARDPRAAATQLVDLACDLRRQESMGKQARRLALEHFDRDVLYVSFCDVLTRVAAQPSPPQNGA
jgi:glycosyltransferase involved in cell wall biosynthesis